MRILLANIPWVDKKHPDLRGVRAGSRWPHFQKVFSHAKLPRYIPFPFFMAIAAADCRNNGYEVRLIDAVAEGMDFDDFFDKAAEFSPQIVFAETSTPSFCPDLEALALLKNKLPDAVFVCAGSHSPEFAIRHMNKEHFPDYWIAGEYDLSLSKFAAFLEGKTAFSDVPGLMAAGKSIPAFASIETPDSLPTPLFEQLPMQHYSDPVCGLPAPGAQSWLSRGCPYKCSFCVWPQVIYGNRKYRTREIDTALDEVEFLINNYSCESFYFDDDTANIGETRMKELADKIIARGLDRYPWSMMARADCMSHSMIDNLAGAGLYSIKYGVESISEKLLNACDKGTDIDKLKSAIAKTKELGVKTHLTFTFGLPGETVDTIKESLDFAIETAPESAQFSICSPFPGTAFYRECAEKGWLATDDWSRFSGSGEDAVVGTAFLPAAELKRAYENALSRWNEFLADRTEKRKTSLRREIAERVALGRKWAFFGDCDFAAFLFDDCLEGYVEEKGMEDFLVIVSRHDEEKIFRRLLRDRKTCRGDILRLYG